jgi:tRNA modification GTPase
MLDVQDTIVGIATAAGGAPRGVVRLSGPTVLQTLASCFMSDTASPLDEIQCATATAGQLQLADGLGWLPGELYLWPDGRSYTRQPSAEFHTLGSPPLLQSAVRALTDRGARLAGPGEFTMRAFLAGRLDLTQAEAVLGVIDANDRASLDVALNQLAGGVVTPLHKLREDLLDLLAHVEAGLDFVEEDIEFVESDVLRTQLALASRQLDELTVQLIDRGTSDTKRRVVLFGRPNVGKSTLFNVLLGRDAALVSERAGTTRDYLTADLELGQLHVQLIDTAGLDETVDRPIDAAAQQMTDTQHRAADLQLHCFDVSCAPTAVDLEASRQTDAKRIVIWTKCDRATPPVNAPGFRTSAASGLGVNELRDSIRDWALDSMAADLGLVPSTLGRCRNALKMSTASVRRASAIAEAGAGEELVAAELRDALTGLGEVVGAVYTDDVLDRIFSRFCIGK